MPAAVPHDWNTDRETLTRGNRFRVSVGPRNYLRAGYDWQKINTTISSDRSLTTFPASVQFARTSQGWTEFSFDSRFSTRRKIACGDSCNAEPAFELNVLAMADHNVNGEIDGHQIVYPNAWDHADLLYRVANGKNSRIEKLVRIHGMPAGDSEFLEYHFRLRSPHAKLWTGHGYKSRNWQGLVGQTAEINNVPAFIARRDSTIRGAVLDTPSCWYVKQDGTIVREPVRVTLKVMLDMTQVLAVKHIPRRMVAAALAEGTQLYTDATFKTDDPGAIGSDHVAFWTGNATFATAKAGSGTGWSDQFAGYENAWWISSAGTSGNYDRLQRCFIFFDTSSASGTVTDGDLQVYYHGAADNFTMFSATNVYGTTSTGTTSGAAADFQTATSTAYSSSIAWPGSAGFNTFDLNASGLAACDVDGFSRFCVASVKDLGASPPTWVANKDAYWQIRFDEYTGDFGPRLNLTTEEVSLPAGGFIAATLKNTLRSSLR